MPRGRTSDAGESRGLRTQAARRGACRAALSFHLHPASGGSAYDEVSPPILRPRPLILPPFVERPLFAVRDDLDPCAGDARRDQVGARAAWARNSPSAMLYSAVPRSSQ